MRSWLGDVLAVFEDTDTGVPDLGLFKGVVVEEALVDVFTMKSLPLSMDVYGLDSPRNL